MKYIRLEKKLTLTEKSFFNFISEQKIVKKSKIKKFFEKKKRLFWKSAKF